VADPSADSLGAIASVSHELRAPLHAIVGLSELLVSAELGPHERELATAIHREGQALQVIIDDLLDLSKINAGKMTLLVEPFSPRALFDEVVTMFGPSATAKGLVVTLELSDELPLVVRGDRHRLRQVLVNLVSNAVKYTDAGSIELSASLVEPMISDEADADEMWLGIDVADTGPGIPEAALADLFVPFKQAREGDRLQGTGLGLSITQQLAELMHGDLTLDTSPAGSTFTVRVPVRKARRTEDRIIAHQHQRSARVLVVDDADVNRMVARSQLGQLGHTPVEASNGADAFTLLTTESFDAVLMDWHMPHQDGLETVELYLAWADKQGATTPPIIMMTADVSANARTRCAEAGTSDFLPKPVSLNDLDMCLRKWLPQHSADDAATDPVRDNAPSGNGSVDIASPRAAIDRTILDKMTEDLGGSEPVAMVIAAFLDDANQRRASLASAPVEDPETARRAAHTLKSTSAMLGATDLSATCQLLETQLRNPEADATAVDANDLARFNTQLDAALRALQEISAEFSAATAPPPPKKNRSSP